MSGAANAIDEEWVEKKLKSANGSQDSVQSLSLWALNHKTQHEKIVGIWFKVLKAAKLELRLTLFYLCNEVVQTCKRKHAIVFKDAFKEVLKDAALLVRDNLIRPNIERIFKIWGERHVYNREFVDELMAILNNTKVKSTLSTRLLTEFKPDDLMSKIRRVAEFEEDVEMKRLQLSDQDWYSVDVESFKQQLKDRHECGRYVDEANECQMQLESYVTDLQHENQHRSSLIEMLEQSELFYDAQNSEAAIVATAYKNFGSRVNTLCKKLCESRKPQKNSRTASSKVEQKSQAKKIQDPTATPTEDEFDDDSCDGFMNSSLQNGDSSDDLSENDGIRRVASDDFDQRNSKDGSKSPMALSDSRTTDAINSFGSFLSNLDSSVTSSFLPSVASHKSCSLELLNTIRGCGPTAFSNNTAPVDEDAGGATPVQDEEPNDEVSLGPMEFLKQIIQESTKSAVCRLPAGSDVSLAWTAFDSAFSDTESHAETVEYEDGYEVVYQNTEIGQELSATAVYGPETVPTYEVYAPTYSHRSDALQTYMIEAGMVEGYPCSADGYDTVVEAYPPNETEYQAAYGKQLLSVGIDDGYNEIGDTYSVVQEDNYGSHAMSAGSFYGVVEHVQGISPQPSVVYHPVQSYTQPPPHFPHPSLSLAPTQSFSCPPLSISQATTLAFIRPTSFTTPPPLNQPPPPLFTQSQNLSQPPLISQSFIEPPPPSPYRLISPTSKAAIGLPSPPVIIPVSSSALEAGLPNCLTSPSFRSQSGLKSWSKKPYNQFKSDHSRSFVALRDYGHFENITSHLDAHRMGRLPQKTRRTNLTYLTTNEDRNGINRAENHSISLAPVESKPQHSLTAIRSMSFPCDIRILKSVSTGQANGIQSTSPKPASCGDTLTLASDSLGAQTDQRLGRNDFPIEKDLGNLISNNTRDRCGGFEKSVNNNGEDSIQHKQNMDKNSSPTQSTVCNIPSLGIPFSAKSLMPTNFTRCHRPELGSLRPLGSFRFQANATIRQLPRKTHFVTQMPFQRNF